MFRLAFCSAFFYFLALGGANQAMNNCRKFILPNQIKYLNHEVNKLSRKGVAVPTTFCAGEDHVLTSIKQLTQNVEQVYGTVTQILNNQKLINLNIDKKVNDLEKKMVQNGPRDCAELSDSGVSKPGVYKIYPSRYITDKPVSTYCETDEDGTWTVIMRREKKGDWIAQVDFYRDWAAYKTGFGSPDSEYWLGNENLHRLTADRHYIVRLELITDQDKVLWGVWTTFKVDSEKNKYKLTVGQIHPRSTAPSYMLLRHNGAPFSTFDQDNDSSDKNCAETYKGGFWYTNCFFINPTGAFAGKEKTGIPYFLLNQNHTEIRYAKTVRLMIKPMTHN